MPIVIRDATNRDITLLATLIRDSFRDVAVRFGLTPENCPTHPSNCTQAWIDKAMAKGIPYYVLDEDGTPAGCVAMERASPDVCYLERLAVLPQCRGRGLGTALVNHVLSEARQRGMGRVEIAIIAEHTDLRDWYGRRGFAVKETKRFNHLPFAVTFMAANV